MRGWEVDPHAAYLTVDEDFLTYDQPNNNTDIVKIIDSNYIILDIIAKYFKIVF